MEKTSRNQIILLILILAIAAFFRFYKLTEVPPGLYPDVAINGNDAATALANHNFRVFYPENNGREGLFINAIAVGFAFFGISVWSIKIVAAIIGFLTVLGLYLMLKELFRGKKQSNLIALLSSFFLAASFWHILFSRIGFRAIMVPFFLVWGFYCLFKAMRMMRIEHTNDANKFRRDTRLILHTLYFILSGVLFGLGFHTYISYRVVPAIWMIVLLIEIYKQGLSERSAHYNYWPRLKARITNYDLRFTNRIKNIFIGDGWWFWGICLLAIIFAALPIVLYFYHNPQDFMGRSTQVSIFASENPVKQLAVNTVKTLGMFNVSGDCNWRHNYACQPEIFWPVGILFLIGLATAFKQFFEGLFLLKRQETDNNQNIGWSSAQISLFLLTWFFSLLLPEILSSEGLPHSLRAIGAIPPVFIFSGMGGVWLIEKFRTQGHRFRTVKNIAITTFLLVVLAHTYNYYFIDWGKNPEVQGAYTQHFVDIGNYLNGLPADAKKYVIVNEGGVPVPFPDGIPMPAQTIMFITHGTPNIAYLKPEQLQSVTGKSTIVLMKYDKNILNQLQEMFPDGKILDQKDIWSFEVNPKHEIRNPK